MAKEDLEGLQNESVKIVLEHLRDQKHPCNKVDFALMALAAVGRIKATERARDATQYAVLRSLTENKEEFKKYVEISLPHLNPIKQIE